MQSSAYEAIKDDCMTNIPVSDPNVCSTYVDQYRTGF